MKADQNKISPSFLKGFTANEEEIEFINEINQSVNNYEEQKQDNNADKVVDEFFDDLKEKLNK